MTAADAADAAPTGADGAARGASGAEAEKTLLMVSYEFPPAGGPAVQRAAKFAKYLPLFGWRPVVLTARPSAARPRDASLLADVEGVEVHVTAGVELSHAIARVLAPLKPMTKAALSRAGSNAAGPAHVSGAAASGKAALSTRLAAWISVPDDRMLWRWLAGGAAARLADAVKADAVFSTAPPWTAHLVAMRAAAPTRPWVADFRDPWAGSGYLYRPTAWHRRRDAVWERRVVERADAITCISQPVADGLVGAPRRPPTVLPNGFDPEDVPARRPHPGLPLRMVYTGAFYEDRNPLAFLDALAALRGERPDLASAVRVELIGPSSLLFAPAARVRGLDDLVTLTGHLPHDTCLARLAEADVALLFIAPGAKSRVAYTGKLFEYMGLGVPILAMAPDGVAADLIAEASAGIVVDPEDPVAIAGAIRELIGAKETAGASFAAPDAEVVARFDRRRQTGELAALLDGLVAGVGGVGA